jgi:hypothetical protein
MREAAKMEKSGIKLTPALRRMLEFIVSGEEHGRMIVQIVATGGRSVSQLDALRSAGYVEYYYAPEGGPDRIRITAAGRSALTGQASLSSGATMTGISSISAMTGSALSVMRRTNGGGRP